MSLGLSLSKGALRDKIIKAILSFHLLMYLLHIYFMPGKNTAVPDSAFFWPKSTDRLCNTDRIVLQTIIVSNPL